MEARRRHGRDGIDPRRVVRGCRRQQKMQEQEGGRRGVGEKNKWRMGSGGRETGGCELEKDGEKGNERNGVCRE